MFGLFLFHYGSNFLNISPNITKFAARLFYMDTLLLLLKGVIIGLAATIPLGPIGVLCVQRTINKGRASGFISGLGAATSDTFYATIASFSLAFIIDFIDSHRLLIEIVGAAVIIVLGLKTFYTNPLSQLRQYKRRKNRIWEDYVTTLLLTLTNPLIIFYFIALFAMGNVVNTSHFSHTLLVLLGVFAGGVLWWYMLTSTVNRFRHKFRLKHLWWINKVAGALIVLLGVLAVFSAAFGIL